ncbi:hypothetical protein [Kitasatospora sp. NPDC088134]|uniref:hypothetical protein n=1 Tax=Kitasatospora sp. NPDC088134 TaxID=3364071 RepID=UPI00380F2383
MDGAEFIASAITTGKLHGVGIGSSLAEVENVFRAGYVDDPDAEENLSLRRDYGLVEFSFNDGLAWTVVGASIEIHRLAVVEDLAAEWQEAQGVDFPEYLTWNEIAAEISRIPGHPELTPRTDQTGYIEYRSPTTRVSALVVDGDEERDEERDDWPGRGDVFSIALGQGAGPRAPAVRHLGVVRGARDVDRPRPWSRLWKIRSNRYMSLVTVA